MYSGSGDEVPEEKKYSIHDILEIIVARLNIRGKFGLKFSGASYRILLLSSISIVCLHLHYSIPKPRVSYPSTQSRVKKTTTQVTPPELPPRHEGLPRAPSGAQANLQGSSEKMPLGRLALELPLPRMALSPTVRGRDGLWDPL